MQLCLVVWAKPGGMCALLCSADHLPHPNKGIHMSKPSVCEMTTHSGTFGRLHTSRDTYAHTSVTPLLSLLQISVLASVLIYQSTAWAYKLNGNCLNFLCISCLTKRDCCSFQTLGSLGLENRAALPFLVFIHLWCRSPPNPHILNHTSWACLWNARRARLPEDWNGEEGCLRPTTITPPSYHPTGSNSGLAGVADGRGYKRWMSEWVSPVACCGLTRPGNNIFLRLSDRFSWSVSFLTFL